MTAVTASNFCVVDEILFYKGPAQLKWRVVVPFQILEKLIKETHERYGHVGFAKTFAALNDYFWFKGLRTTVKNIVLQCNLCQSVKPLNKSIAGPFLPVSATRLNEFIAIDFNDPLPLSTGGSNTSWFFWMYFHG